MLRLDSFPFILFVLLGLSCHKAERSEISWKYLEISTSENLEQIDFDKNGIGHIVGGDTWNLGIYGKSADGGSSWVFDSIANKRLFDLSFDQENNGYASGIDGNLLFLPDGGDWQFNRVGIYKPQRGVAFWSNTDGGITVSGEGFASGAIQRFDSKFNRIQLDTMDYEFADVVYSDAATVHIAGYGIILRSSDAGVSWERKEVEGDFFQEIQFLDPQNGYIVGVNGSILKTTDAGQNWEFLREGNKLTVSDAPFRALHFVDVNRGYVAGDRGNLWFTNDAGESWIRFNNLPNENFLDVIVHEDVGFLVGEGGVLIRFELF